MNVKSTDMCLECLKKTRINRVIVTWDLFDTSQKQLCCQWTRSLCQLLEWFINYS